MPDLQPHPEPPPAAATSRPFDVVAWLYDNEVPLFLFAAAVVVVMTGYGL